MSGTGTIDGGAAFSRRLVFSLLAMLGLFLAAFAGTLLWLAREHDALAASNAQLMIERGIEVRAQRVAGFASDYSYWDEAMSHIAARDMAWVYASMASAVENEPFDLFLLVYPDGAEAGWTIGDTDPREGVLPAAVRDRLLAVKRETYRRQSTISDVVEIDGTLWHFSAAHIGSMLRDLPPEAAWSAPIAIYGKPFLSEDAAAIGDEVLIDGAALAARAPADPGVASAPLRDASGAAQAFVTWPRPAPGTAILTRLAPPIALILLGLVLVALAIGRHVARSARRLERALEEAQAADRAKSEFLTTISHELRTPMNGVIGVAQLLEDTPLDEEQGELVAILNDSAASQMALIEELLSFGEIEAGALRLREEAVALGPLLAEATGAARIAATGKGLALRVLAPEDAPLVMIDPRRLRQVLVNLVGNAVKFTDQGHVEVAARFEPRGEGETVLRLSVSDTGPGIPPDQHERVFERFTQADGSTRRRKGGTGLGLSISRAIARAMGGDIALDSAPGRGSNFTLSVPLRMVPRAAEAAPLEAAA